MMKIIAAYIVLFVSFVPSALMAQGDGYLIVSDYELEAGDMQAELEAAERYFLGGDAPDDAEDLGALEPAAGGLELDGIASAIFSGKPAR